MKRSPFICYSRGLPNGLPVDSQWTPSGLPVDYHQTFTRLPPDFHQTHSKLQTGLNLESSFGELFWKANFESPFKELLWKLIVFYGEIILQIDTQQTPNRLPIDSTRL